LASLVGVVFTGFAGRFRLVPCSLSFVLGDLNFYKLQQNDKPNLLQRDGIKRLLDSMSILIIFSSRLAAVRA
jgi:hypothetical protein